MSTLQRQLQVIMDRLKVLAKNQPRARRELMRLHAWLTGVSYGLDKNMRKKGEGHGPQGS